MSNPSPARHGMTNWATYNVALRKSGSLLIWQDWPVPDQSTLCSRQKTLAVQIPYRRADGKLSLLVDSTGFKFVDVDVDVGVGEWQSRKHRVQRRRQ